jgi:TonB family protein
MKSLLCVAASCLILPSLWCQNPVADLAESLRKKIEADPASSQKHFDLALLLLEQGALETAELEFNAALRADRKPQSAVDWSHEYLGDIYSRTGRPVLAAEEYLAALCTEARVAATRNLKQLGWMEDDINRVCNPRIPAAKPKVVPPEVLEKTNPDYTDEARVAELEGSVLVQATIGEDGHAYDFKVTRPLGLGLDEKAIEAVKNWRFKPAEREGRPEAASSTVSVDFLLGPKQSRWHLIQAAFDVPADTSRPVFQRADFPRGDGILSRSAYEEGRIVGAIGRAAFVTLEFAISEQGIPVNPRVVQASEDVWPPEAILVVQPWRFKPAMKEGRPVPGTCKVELIWGPQEIGAALASGYLLASQK